MKEQLIQRKIIQYLESIDTYVVKVITSTKAGVPDILACYKGMFIAIEVKTPETQKNVSELQKYNLARIQELGGHTLVAWSVEQVEEFINGLA